jgi:hypothetical protein
MTRPTPERHDDFKRSLDDLNPVWIQWLCEALAQGSARASIEQALSEQGHDDPAHLIDSTLKHPIFEWGFRAFNRAKRAAFYSDLNAQLWESSAPQVPRHERLSSEAFYQDYYTPSRPVIITDWVTHWPAYREQKWSAPLWESRFADVEVEVIEGRESHPRFDMYIDPLRRRTLLGAFAKRVIEASPTNDFYMIARNYTLDHPQLSTLFDEIIESPYMNPEKRSGCVALWFGPQGTVTPLHHDTCNIFFAQVWGEKRVTLIPPHHQELFETSTNMYSDRDPELERLCEGQITLDLKAGEALFIPIGWWHHIRALSPSISLAMTHFLRSNQFQWYQPGQVRE